MAAIAADRNLLFGLLALQNGLVNQAQLVAAFQAWTLDKARPLADHLLALGHLNDAQRAVVEAMADLHVAKHGDVERSLAAIPAGRSTQESLARLGDPDIEGTLAHVRSPSTRQDGEPDADRTATYSVGSATSDGLRFRVLRPHARGGLGAVFVALDQELHREVALKQILDSHADDPISRQRFLLEAEVTGSLEHPGIVPVYGLGTHADGRPYYAMRFIRGDSLKEAIGQFHADDDLEKDSGRRSLELRKLLKRFTDVCNAIEYAHSRGVLHRDIKPGNIIVGKHGETLVVDWGVAKPLGRVEPGVHSGERMLLASSASGSASTLPGSVLGTPAYMSPEQSEGDLENLGPRSDVYSLGATLYSLLTGKPPFEGDPADVIRGVQKGQFPPPRQIDPSIDQALEVVCLKAMALKTEDRYASPKALAEDIERWMANEPVKAWREPWTRSLIRWLTRHRVGVTALGAAMLVALVGTLTVLGVQTRANAALKAANTELAIASTKVTNAATDLAAANQRERARFALAQDAIRTFHTRVSKDVLLKQEEFKALRTKLLREAREFYRKLEGLLEGHEDRDSRLALGRAYLEVGELTRQLDSIEEAEKVDRRALALLEALSSESPSDGESRRSLALCLRSLATILEAVGKQDAALATFGRSRDLFQALAAADPADRRLQREWANAEIKYGMSLLSSGRPPAEAVQAVERARSILDAAEETDPRSEDLQSAVAEVYGMLAIALDSADRVEEALAMFQRARDRFEVRFRANPNDEQIGHELARTLGNLGMHLARAGRLAEGLAAHERALAVLKVASRANPTILRLTAVAAWNETNAAAILGELGRNEAALAALGRAREARELLVKANPTASRSRQEWMRIVSMIVDIHRSAGTISEALPMLDQAQQFLGSLVKDHPQTREFQRELAVIYNWLGDTYGAKGKPAEARASFDAALAIERQLADGDPNASSPSLADTLRRRGIAMQKCGRPAEAVQNLRQSIALLQALTEPTPYDYYCLARSHSLLSGVAAEAGSGLTAADGRAEADHAVASLQRAFAAGWNNLYWIRRDLELIPIRSRSDFQLLMMDMVFPAKPFSKGTGADR
jgi:serine/threonine-protein kinase